MLCAYQKDHCGSNVEDAGIRWLPGSRGKNDEGLDREGGIWEKTENTRQETRRKQKHSYVVRFQGAGEEDGKAPGMTQALGTTVV